MTRVNPIPTTHLKPERIGLTSGLVGRSPLKPERIGLRLQKLPGWELLTTADDSQALWRGFRFHRTETAAAFAAFVARVAAEHGQQPLVSQSWNEVTVTVPGEGSLTDRAFDFAETLMLLPVDAGGASDEGSNSETPPETPSAPQAPSAEQAV